METSQDQGIRLDKTTEQPSLRTWLGHAYFPNFRRRRLQIGQIPALAIPENPPTGDPSRECGFDEAATAQDVRGRLRVNKLSFGLAREKQPPLSGQSRPGLLVWDDDMAGLQFSDRIFN